MKQRQITSDDVTKFVNTCPTHQLLNAIIEVMSPHQLLLMFDKLNHGTKIEQSVRGGRYWETETVELVTYDPSLPHVPKDS